VSNVRCEECLWEGDWDDVHVRLHDKGTGFRWVGPDPHHTNDEPPYFCPECVSEDLTDLDARAAMAEGDDEED
jgi:hypothetical protein